MDNCEPDPYPFDLTFFVMVCTTQSNQRHLAERRTPTSTRRGFDPNKRHVLYGWRR